MQRTSRVYPGGGDTSSLHSTHSRQSGSSKRSASVAPAGTIGRKLRSRHVAHIAVLLAAAYSLSVLFFLVTHTAPSPGSHAMGQVVSVLASSLGLRRGPPEGPLWELLCRLTLLRGLVPALVRRLLGRLVTQIAVDKADWQRAAWTTADLGAELPRLHTLKLTGCGLESLPPLLPPSLRVLDVADNRLPPPALCAALLRTPLLTTLKIVGNPMGALPAEAVLAVPGLEVLDAAGCQLAALPPEVGRLPRLQMLNLMNNNLTAVPPQVGALASLKNLGLKGNQLQALPREIGQLRNLEGLFLTDNLLKTLPDEINGLSKLRKLQAASNRLEGLPAHLGGLESMELLRVPVNALAAVPPAFFDAMPRLCWVSLAGNPMCPSPPLRELPRIALSELEWAGGGRQLGEAGASGAVKTATWRGQSVAIKSFTSEVSPDGRAEDELAVAAFVDHPALVRAAALAEGGPRGSTLLVMEQVQGARALGLRPNFQSVLRCRYSPTLSFTPAQALKVARRLAWGLEYMHAAGACHGDVYAHNVLIQGDGTATICDFGASFFYRRDPSGPNPLELMEVRGYGLLLKDLVDRLRPLPAARASAADAEVSARLAAALEGLVADTTQPELRRRPTFAAIVRRLSPAEWPFEAEDTEPIQF